MVNVHASGGRRMMEASRNEIEKRTHKPLLIGVTVLTSMEAEDLADVGIKIPVQEHVVRLAKLAQNSGLDVITRGFHHAASAGRMDIHHPHAKISGYTDSFGAGIGDVVKFEVKKDVVATFMQLLKNDWATGGEEFFTDLHPA